MNAGIVMLQDGTPCIAYDEALPFSIRHVEFSRDDYQITLVYEAPGETTQGRKFEIPLDHPFVNLLEQRGTIAVAYVKNKQLLDIKLYSVIFVPD